MSASENHNTDEILHLEYLVSNGMRGGVSFTVNLLVNSVTKEVLGCGKVFQATNPPLNIQTSLVGEWSWMCTMESCNILVVLDGYSRFAPLIHAVPQLTQNTKLRMSLNSNLESGTATFEYMKNGEMVESGYMPVKLISEKHATGLISLAEKEHELFKESIPA